MAHLTIAHGVIWLLGMAGIAFAGAKIYTQIQQARMSEQAARDDRDKTGRYLNIAAEIIVSLDAGGNIILLNDSGYRLLGYESGTLIGKNWFDTCIPEKSKEEVAGIFEKIKNGEVDLPTFINPVLIKNGTERKINWRNTVLRDEAGVFLGISSSGEDITESTRDAIMTLEPPSWAFTSGNPATVAMFGAESADSFISSTPGDLSPELQPDGRMSAEKSIEMIGKAMREGSHFFEWTHRRIDGKDFPASVLLTRMEIAGKRILQATVRDITDQKLAEHEREKTLLWQQGVSNLMQSLLAPATTEAKLAIITDGIVRIFDVDFCRIWLIRSGDLCEQGCAYAGTGGGSDVCRSRDRCLHLVASSGRYTHTDGPAHCRIPFGYMTIGGIASGEEHRFLINDVQNDSRIYDPVWARELGLVSYAGYQLRVPGGESMGVLALFSKHRISPVEDALLDGISSALGTVIRQAITENALRLSEERFAMILGAVNDGFWDWDIPSGIAIYSPVYYSILGYDDGELPTSYASWRLLVHPDDIDRVERDRQQSVNADTVFSTDFRMKMKSGEWRWVSSRGKVFKRDENGKVMRIAGIMTDITERKQAEKKITMLLSERELLLKEVHHRIKNNMTMISGMLTLQAARLTEPDAVRVLRESINRVKSMAVIYDLLYRTVDFRYVSVREYLGKIVDGIVDSLPPIDGVTVEKRIDDFVMDSKILFPIGIIINELVTNAYKYAFPDGSPGTITILVSCLPENNIEIIVHDDGAGIPEAVDINRQKGFGMKLVDLMVKQIEGTYVCVRDGGTTFSIKFTYAGGDTDKSTGTG